jgi:hypothetical protein
VNVSTSALKKKDDEGESTMIRRRSSLGVTHTVARGQPKSMALPHGAGTNHVRASTRAADSARVQTKLEILVQAQTDGRLLSWSEGATAIANDPNFGALDLAAKFASLWRPAKEVEGSSSEDREQIGVFVRPAGGGVVTRVVNIVITGQCKVQTCATPTKEASEDALTFGHAILAFAGAPGLVPTAVLGREAAAALGSKFNMDIVVNTLGVLPPAKISGESNETTDNFMAFFSVLLTTMSPGTGYNILCANHNETCDAGFTIATAINDAGRRTYSFKKNCGGGGVAAYKLALPHMLENVRTRAAALADGAVGDEIYHLSFSGRMTFSIKNGTSKQIRIGSNQVMGAKLPHVGYLKQVSSSGMPNLTSLADAMACIDGMDALRMVQAVIRWWAANDPNWAGCNITAVDAATTTADACAIAALTAGTPNGRGFTPAQCAAGGKKGGGAKGSGAATAAAFAKDNEWTVVCQAEYDKSVRSAAKMSDKARDAVEKLLVDMGLDAAKEFGHNGKVKNWFANRNNAFVCESCSTLCSSEANYRKHLCMGLCDGGRKVLSDADIMLKFTSTNMPGKKKMAEKHKKLSDVLEKQVLEAKEKKKK